MLPGTSPRASGIGRSASPNDEQINAIIRAFEMPSIDHPLLKGAELSPKGSEPTFLVAEKCGLASFAVTSSGR